MAERKRETPEARLCYLFKRNGCVRRKNQQRYETEEYGKYKKGYEIRLVARDERELEELLIALEQAGFKAGRPFVKVHRTVVPVYGRVAVERFLEMVERETGTRT